MEKKNNSKKSSTKDNIRENSKFKSITLKALLGSKDDSKTTKSDKNNTKKAEKENNEIKDRNSVSLSDIISKIKDMPEKALEKEIANIKEDITAFKLNVGIDKSAIEILENLEKNPNKETIKQFLESFTQTMSIDVDSMADLSSKQLQSVRKYCKVDKVYVNSGWDVSAKEGYSVEKYAKIRANADKMIESALKQLPETASETDKFKAIYKAVLKAEHYDRQALNTNAPDYKQRRIKSRSLEGFFLNGRSVCAGTADALKQLCECIGLEAEYVQGDAQSRHQNKSSYHAWMKVKVDGKWYNADPTWDANHAGKPYEYCLKSDKEFSKDHKEDRAYNPTYRRNRKETERTRYSTETRNYHKSDESVTRTMFTNNDNKIFNEKRKLIEYEESQLTDEEKQALYYEATEQDYERMNNEYAPYSTSYSAPYTVNKIENKKSFGQFIAGLIAKFKMKIQKIRSSKENNNSKSSIENNESVGQIKIDNITAYQVDKKSYEKALRKRMAQSKIEAKNAPVKTDTEKTK